MEERLYAQGNVAFEDCIQEALKREALYVYWQSAEDRAELNGRPHCHAYKSCNEYRSPDGTGSNYQYTPASADQYTCPGKLLQLVLFLISSLTFASS